MAVWQAVQEVGEVLRQEGESREVGGGRKVLKDKLVLSGIGEGERMWEEVYSRVASRWDMGQVKEIYLGSDGTDWAKRGVDYFDFRRYTYWILIT